VIELAFLQNPSLCSTVYYWKKQEVILLPSDDEKLDEPM